MNRFVIVAILASLAVVQSTTDQEGVPPSYDEVEGQPSTNNYQYYDQQQPGAPQHYQPGQYERADTVYDQQFEPDRGYYSTRSAGEQVSASFSAAAFGFVLLAVAGFLIFWNEGRTVRRQAALEEASKTVKEADVNKLDPALDGSLVHVTGRAVNDVELADQEFGITFGNVLGFSRTVEMLQWKQEEHKSSRRVQGGTVHDVTYTYSKEWSTTPINSFSFKNKQIVPQNAPDMGVAPLTQRPAIRLGAFVLANSQKSVFRCDTPFTAFPANIQQTAAAFSRGRPVYVMGNALYFGNPNNAQINDVKVSFHVAQNNQSVSVLARQSGNTFAPYASSSGDSIEICEVGEKSAAALIQSEETTNAFFKWVLRTLGVVLMWMGVGLTTAPLSTLFSFVPFIGSLLSGLTSFIAFFVALSLAFFIMAIAWIWYRPKVGIILLCAAIALIVLSSRLASPPLHGAPAAPSFKPVGSQIGECAQEQKALTDCLGISSQAQLCEAFMKALHTCKQSAGRK